MDFLDDLDKAFDNMFSGDSVETIEHQVEETVQHVMPDVGDLRDDLTRQHLAPIAVLASDIGTFQRRYLLAALAGGIAHLKAVDHNPERLGLIKELEQLVRTGKGAIRKKMSQAQRDELQGLLRRVCDHFGELSDHEASELLLTLQNGAIDLDTVYILFQSGISCPRMMRQAPEHEIAHITHLDQTIISRVKALFTGTA